MILFTEMFERCEGLVLWERKAIIMVKEVSGQKAVNEFLVPGERRDWREGEHSLDCWIPDSGTAVAGHTFQSCRVEQWTEDSSSQSVEASFLEEVVLHLERNRLAGVEEHRICLKNKWEGKGGKVRVPD